jgi:hypothetical protein
VAFCTLFRADIKPRSVAKYAKRTGSLSGAPSERRATLGRMKRLRTTLVAIACLAAAMATSVAWAQWQWIDKDGRKVFSDQPPPPGTPNDKIVKRPGNRPPEPEPAAAPAPAAAAASMPKVSGKDKELEDKKNQAATAEAAKKKAAEEENAKLKADNCTRAKQAKATIDSGVRLTVTNDKGEREIMDDNARAAETKRLDGVIARSCS